MKFAPGDAVRYNGFDPALQMWVAACLFVGLEDVYQLLRVRRYLVDLINLRMIIPPLRLPFRPLLTFLTAGFLAPVFREALGLRWGGVRQFCFEALFLHVAFVTRFLPLFIRQGGSYLLLADAHRGFVPDVG